MIVALTGGTLVDGNGGQPLPNATILIEDERITQVGHAANTPTPPGARVIDLAGKWVMPGMVDGHIHMCGEPDPDPAYPLKGLAAYASIRGVAAALKLLDMGFTAARDMADINFSGVALKQAIDLGVVPGPRPQLVPYWPTSST